MNGNAALDMRDSPGYVVDNVRRLRRTVNVSDEVADRCKGGRTKLWAFGIVDFARVLGINEDLMRRRVRDGKFDPTTLEGIAEGLKGQV